MIVTLETVAQEAGFDRSTVAKVLSGKARKARISPRCETIVRAVAAKMNYRPNAAARAVNVGSFGCVALLLSTGSTNGNLPIVTLKAIHDELARHDLHMMLSRLPDAELINEGVIPKILRQLMADGLLINYTDHIPRPMLDLMARYRLPSIWLNCKLANDSVHPDDFGAGIKLTEYLLSQGHRRVAYVDYSYAAEDLAHCHYSTRDRQAGYEKVMAAAGLTPQIIRGERVNVRAQESRQFTVPWLSAADRPTAAVTYSIFETVPVGWVARDLGLRLPQDFQIVTFHEEAVELADIPIPTCLVPQARLGRKAVELMLQKLTSPGSKLETCAVPFPFVRDRREADASSEW